MASNPTERRAAAELSRLGQQHPTLLPIPRQRRRGGIHRIVMDPKDEVRFWQKVSPPDQNGCCKWTGVTSNKGYGQFHLGGRKVLAHRVAYTLVKGEIPEGMELDHVRSRGCRSTLCTNVDHLEPVTREENNLRSSSATALNAGKTACASGHPYDEANTRYRKSGRRACRACDRDRTRRRRAGGAGR